MAKNLTDKESQKVNSQESKRNLKDKSNTSSTSSLNTTTSSGNRNGDVNIFLVSDSKTVPVSVPKFGMGEWRIKKSLQLLPNQLVQLKIVALKDITDPSQKEIILEQNQFASTLSMLMPTSLIENHSYEVVFKIKREDQEKNLSKQERQDIEAKFTSIDQDGDGLVSINEIRNYYTNIAEASKKILKEKAILISEIKPVESHRVNNLIDQASHSLDRMVEITYQSFIKTDNDLSRKIDFLEFLNYEARMILARKMKGNDFEGLNF